MLTDTPCCALSPPHSPGNCRKVLARRSILRLRKEQDDEREKGCPGVHSCPRRHAAGLDTCRKRCLTEPFFRRGNHGQRTHGAQTGDRADGPDVEGEPCRTKALHNPRACRIKTEAPSPPPSLPLFRRRPFAPPLVATPLSAASVAASIAEKLANIRAPRQQHTAMALQTYTHAEVQKHNGGDSCWVIHNNNVYDVTSFVMDHPGGEEFILDHAGRDITLLMKDELSHFHSEGAYEMLDEFLVGSVKAPTSTTKVAQEQTSTLRNRSTTTATVSTESTTTTAADDSEEAYFKPTDLNADKKIKFLDLSQPLLWQLWNSNFSKAFYLEQVHIPRHLSGSARIFGSPFLEVFTKTPWYMVPIFWMPVIVYNFRKSLENGLTADQASTLFLCGMGLWTLAEYGIHRFLFHLDDRMPDTNISLVAHFLLHGIHHYLPMDRLRLVMPPALAVALAIPLFKLAHMLLAAPQANAVMSGLIFGYVLYDLTHYYLHHARVFKIHFKEMKTYHLAHHYKDFEGGYGITSKIWDKVFNTELQL